MRPDEALRLWDEECRAKWPRGADPATEVNGRWLAEIASEANGCLSDVWGRTELRRVRPRLYLDHRQRLEAIIADLDAAVVAVADEARPYFIRLRDIAGWVMERPRETPVETSQQQSG